MPHQERRSASSCVANFHVCSLTRKIIMCPLAPAADRTRPMPIKIHAGSEAWSEEGGETTGGGGEGFSNRAQSPQPLRATQRRRAACSPATACGSAPPHPSPAPRPAASSPPQASTQASTPGARGRSVRETVRRRRRRLSHGKPRCHSHAIGAIPRCGAPDGPIADSDYRRPLPSYGE